MDNEIFHFINSKKEEYIEFLGNICSFEATARDKTELDRMADFIEGFAVAKGFSVKRTNFSECGDFLTIDLNEGQEKGSMFLAHMDTVHKKGAFGYPCVKVENSRMTAPGAIDCKGGIAIAILTMEALQKCGYKKHTRLILTSDEEISNVLGGEQEQEFFRTSVKGFRYALNCETTRENEVVVSRKGILRKEITINGKGGHSGIDYFNSSSAVLEASHKIVKIESNSRKNGATYNCSIINGGSAGNCIPDKCSFTVDIRAKKQSDLKEAENFVQEIADTSYVPGTMASVQTISSRIPMERNFDTEKLFEEFQKISRKYGLGELVPVESGGGSDSAYTQAAGVPSLCGLGGEGDFCHTSKEYIDLASITKRAKLVSAFCSKT